MGSSSFVTDETGKVFEHIEYFPYGELFGHEHSNTQITPYRFTGKEYDEVTGLYYYGARYYDPRTSVWQSVDPILGEYMSGKTNGGVFNPKNLNLFGYTYGNPVNLVDPDGNNPKLLVDFGMNIAIAYATEGKLTWSAVKMAGVDTIKDALNPMATVNKFKKLKRFADGRLRDDKGKFVFDGGTKKVLKTSSNNVPNPSGRLGKQTTKNHIDDVATEMEKRGFTITGGGNRLPEEFLPGPSGKLKGASYPDITAIKNGRTLRVNTIDTRVDGITPSTREANNALRIRTQRPKDHLLLIAKP